MDFLSYLNKKRQLVDQALEQLLNTDFQILAPLSEAIRYSVFNGGKRLRPILTLMSYEACLKNSKFKTQNSKLKTQGLRIILPFACGVELIHTFSLIQDDLPAFDNAELRRNKPSLFRTFGEAKALLAADALFSLAIKIFALSKVSPKHRLSVINAVSDTVGPRGIVEGQMIDISYQKKNFANPRELRQLHLKKTAQFIATCIKIGAIVASAKEKIQNELYNSGILLGMLFQITDDILDFKEDVNRLTYPKFYGLSGSRFRAIGYWRRAKKAFRVLGPKFRYFSYLADYLLNRSY